MSLIQQAAKRLEELQRAGVEVPWAAARASAQQVRALLDTERGDAAAPGTQPRVDKPLRAVAGTAGSEPPARRSREVQIDLARLAAEGYLLPNQPRSALADQFRVIKRPLLKNASGASEAPVLRGNLIQVTSALPGEGKSFFAINLAMSIAMEVDHSVLLIDADVLRPTLLHRLGLSAEKGLLDVLRSPELDLADVMLRTNVPKLSLLPAGQAHANATELLASSTIDRLMDELATRYSNRIVIFDSPPLLATPESRVLTTRVGQVVMVVEAQRARKRDVAEAFATVSGCPVVLSVLNKSADSETVGLYGY
jgi:receptor protein-tyrosine kinase